MLREKLLFKMNSTLVGCSNIDNYATNANKSLSKRKMKNYANKSSGSKKKNDI